MYFWSHAEKVQPSWPTSFHTMKYDSGCNHKPQTPIGKGDTKVKCSQILISQRKLNHSSWYPNMLVTPTESRGVKLLYVSSISMMTSCYSSCAGPGVPLQVSKPLIYRKISKQQTYYFFLSEKDCAFLEPCSRMSKRWNTLKGGGYNRFFVEDEWRREKLPRVLRKSSPHDLWC